MAKRRWIRLLGMWIAGFLVGYGLCLGTVNWPKQNQLWLNRDTGYLVWTDESPFGEYITFDELREQ